MIRTDNAKPGPPQEESAKSHEPGPSPAMDPFLARLAHQLNNPLSVVIGQAQLLLRDSRDEGVKAKARAILAQAQRAAEIVRNLRTWRGD